MVHRHHQGVLEFEFFVGLSDVSLHELEVFQEHLVELVIYAMLSVEPVLDMVVRINVRQHFLCILLGPSGVSGQFNDVVCLESKKFLQEVIEVWPRVHVELLVSDLVPDQENFLLGLLRLHLSLLGGPDVGRVDQGLVDVEDHKQLLECQPLLFFGFPRSATPFRRFFVCVSFGILAGTPSAGAAH